ncbi:hypothetical protein [Neisseria chenwenguii]|nr:hypothetical protein [Neisseria chenwenguii]
MFYLLNTNKTNCQADHDWMLANRCAATFGKVAHKIDGVAAGSTVFLYESGRGIIACGRAGAVVAETACGYREGRVRHRALEDFAPLAQPLNAAQIKTALGRNVSFLATLIRLPDGEKLLAAQKIQK